MMPFLSVMNKRQRVETHSDLDGVYIVTLKPKLGLVAAFGLTLMADQSWPVDPVESEDYRNSDVGMRQAQRLKAQHPQVAAELAKIVAMAKRNGVDPDNVLLVDCSSGPLTPDEVSILARDAFDRNVAGSKLRGNCLWPSLSNRVGLVMTDMLIDELWDAANERANAI